MDLSHIADLLLPYLGEIRLSGDQLHKISTYIDLLSKWNAKMNLTAVRDPEDIVRRHFGESLFAARHLLDPHNGITVADVGSGAGFPGLPVKIFAPAIQMTLIEAHGKKATFLREMIRSLKLTNINVFQNRAENWDGHTDLVTLRAVEKFEAALPIAASLVAPNGRLALLIGEQQLPLAQKLLPGNWASPIQIPNSAQRTLQTWQKGINPSSIASLNQRS